MKQNKIFVNTLFVRLKLKTTLKKIAEQDFCCRWLRKKCVVSKYKSW